VGMWSKDRAVGNAYPRCPRTGPAPFRRFVHMSTAWGAWVVSVVVSVCL